MIRDPLFFLFVNHARDPLDNPTGVLLIFSAWGQLCFPGRQNFYEFFHMKNTHEGGQTR